MGVIATVGAFFRNKSSDKNESKVYDYVKPLELCVELVSGTEKYLETIFKDGTYRAILSGRQRPETTFETKALTAYQSFVKGLGPIFQPSERQSPLSQIIAALGNIHYNLSIIEDQIPKIAVSMSKGDESTTLSTILMIGYIETASDFATWVNRLLAHLSNDDSVTRFWTLRINDDAEKAGEFAANNLSRWAEKSGGFMVDLANLKKQGLDVTIKTGDTWFDEIVHDNQLSSSDRELISASIANPILLFTRGEVASKLNRIDLLTARNDWLLSKIALTEAQILKLDPISPEYKKKVKSVEYYANLVSKYEQKIERLRG